MATSRLSAERSVTSFPSKRMCPEEGASSPLMRRECRTFSTTGRPHDGQKLASLISRLIPFTAIAPLNRFTRFFISIHATSTPQSVQRCRDGIEKTRTKHLDQVVVRVGCTRLLRSTIATSSDGTRHIAVPVVPVWPTHWPASRSPNTSDYRGASTHRDGRRVRRPRAQEHARRKTTQYARARIGAPAQQHRTEKQEVSCGRKQSRVRGHATHQLRGLVVYRAPIVFAPHSTNSVAGCDASMQMEDCTWCPTFRAG